MLTSRLHFYYKQHIFTKLGRLSIYNIQPCLSLTISHGSFLLMEEVGQVYLSNANGNRKRNIININNSENFKILTHET